MNRRYQKDVKVGSTRKSAAAAKPKRSSSSGSSSKRTSSSKSRSSYQPVQLPPEIKKLQRTSFAMLGGAVAISVLYLWKGKEWGTYGALMLGFAYALMFAALLIDFTRVRPAIKQARGQGAGKAGGKSATTSGGQSSKSKAAEAAAESSGQPSPFGYLLPSWLSKKPKTDAESKRPEATTDADGGGSSDTSSSDSSGDGTD